MTPEALDSELDRIQQEISVLVLNLRAEFTAIGMLRGRLRHHQSDPDCAGCAICERP